VQIEKSFYANKPTELCRLLQGYCQIIIEGFTGRAIMLEQLLTRNREKSVTQGYDHSRYAGRRRVLRWMLDYLAFNLLMKFDGAEGVDQVPKHGPAIVYFNHIAFIDPIIILASLPRNIIPLAKIEAFKYPVWGIFPRIWNVILVRRGEVDRQAIRQALAVLKAGEMVLIAPEGTRNRELQKAKGGLAYLATRSGAPLVPVTVEGTDQFPMLLPFLARKPGARATFGPPFKFKDRGQKPDREELRLMTDEAMYILSRMLPESRRGYYGDLNQATRDTIVDLE
jgi:1-acyl-sn-glycerol-3-phosphate acyltransferase